RGTRWSATLASTDANPGSPGGTLNRPLNAHPFAAVPANERLDDGVAAKQVGCATMRHWALQISLDPSSGSANPLPRSEATLFSHIRLLRDDTRLEQVGQIVSVGCIA